MKHIYSIEYNFIRRKDGEKPKFYTNLKKLCLANDLKYDQLYWHIKREEKGFWSNDYVTVEMHELL